MEKNLFPIILLAMLLLLPISASAETGSIKICRVIVNGQNEIALNSAGLPGGTFAVDLYYREKATSSVAALSALKFSTADFMPNEKALRENISNNIECVTYAGLGWGYYYYSREQNEGSANWKPTLYNDQYKTPVDSLVNFYEYDAETNEDADGVIIIGASRPSRTLMLLNRYETPPTESNTETSGGGGGSSSFSAATVNFGGGNGGGGSGGSNSSGGSNGTVSDPPREGGDQTPIEMPVESATPSFSEEPALLLPSFSENVSPDTSRLMNDFGFDFSFLKYLWLILLLILALLGSRWLLRATEKIKVTKQNSDT